MKRTTFDDLDRQKYYTYERMGVTIAAESDYYTGDRRVFIEYNDHAEKEWQKLNVEKVVYIKNKK
jgi:hypothetical protein